MIPPASTILQNANQLQQYNGANGRGGGPADGTGETALATLGGAQGSDVVQNAQVCPFCLRLWLSVGSCWLTRLLVLMALGGDSSAAAHYAMPRYVRTRERATYCRYQSCELVTQVAVLKNRKLELQLQRKDDDIRRMEGEFAEAKRRNTATVVQLQAEVERLRQGTCCVCATPCTREAPCMFVGVPTGRRSSNAMRTNLYVRTPSGRPSLTRLQACWRRRASWSERPSTFPFRSPA
jgi:hypothetical protein